MDSEGRSYVAFLVILLKKNFLLEFLLYAIVQGSCRRVTGIRQKMERGKKHSINTYIVQAGRRNL